MPLYDGVITVNDGDINVIVAIEDDRIRLSAGGSEIGEWNVDDCAIDLVEDGVFSITAEEESLQFVPNEPSLFARAVSVEPADPEPAAPKTAGRLVSEDDAPTEGYPTRVLIWTLAIAVAGLGIWALVSLF